MKSPLRDKAKKTKTNPFAAAGIKMLEIEVQAAWAERDMQKCVQLLNKVCKMQPRNLEALLLIGRANGMLFKYEEAIVAFEKALDLAPRSERIHTMLRAGSMASRFYDPSIAESFFEEAVEESGTVAAKVALAEYSLRIRKRDIANSLIEEVIKTSPESAQASFLWCLLNESRFAECLDRLNRLTNGQTTELKIKAGYQLAKMLDTAGDYDRAIGALITAKSYLMPSREGIVRNRVNTRAKHIKLAQYFTSTKRVEWQDDENELGGYRNLAFLGGHPRSGTTLLEQVLDSHQDIVSAEETDNFFTFSLSPLLRSHPDLIDEIQVLENADTQELIRLREAYFTAMDNCIGDKIGSRLLIDKNPSLTSLIPAMFRFFPEMKIINLIRDPRDVVISCFLQPFVPVTSVSGNFLTLEDTAAEYAGVMGVWTEIAERFDGNVCEVCYEEMVEDLEGNARRVLDFLGLEWNRSVMDYDRHARDKIVRSPTANAVTEKVHSRAKNRWKNYEKYLEPVFETLNPYLKKFGYE